MAIIYSYPTAVPKLIDKIIITQSYDVNAAAPIEGNPTRAALISDIGDLLGVTTGTANTLPMFSSAGLVDSPIYTVPVIGKLANTTGDLAMYFKYGDERVGGIYLDDDASQQGLSFYVQESATNANIVKKISLREGTTIGTALATTLPPANGLAVQGDVKALGNATFGEDDSQEVTMESTLNIQGPVKDSGSNLGGDQQVLVSNASGNVAWGAFPTGTVKGTGAVNFVPKWSATDTLQNSIIFDDGTNVGIGTSGTNPADKLHVQGAVRAVVAGSSGAAFNATNAFGVTSSIRFGDNHAVLALKNNSNVVAARISSSGFSFFNGGNVGIGTESPASQLTVNGGDIEVEDENKGLILHSPNNTRYRITVANDGTLSTAAI